MCGFNIILIHFLTVSCIYFTHVMGTLMQFTLLLCYICFYMFLGGVGTNSLPSFHRGKIAPGGGHGSRARLRYGSCRYGSSTSSFPKLQGLHTLQHSRKCCYLRCCRLNDPTEHHCIKQPSFWFRYSNNSFFPSVRWPVTASYLFSSLSPLARSEQ